MNQVAIRARSPVPDASVSPPSGVARRPSMLRVLFVDDEPGTLDALRARLRRQEGKWSMTFALGGPAAVDELARGAFDVVVTDMRMPKVDGAELLRRVHAQQPQVVRILLSSHAEMESVLRSAPVAHRYLNKPCDPQELESAIERANGLRALVTSDSVRRSVGRIRTLPSLPRIYAELTRALEDPRAGVGEVSRVLGRDVAMSAKILQLVNCAFLRPSQRITKIDHAVGYLGVEMVKSLVLSAEVFRTAGADPRARRSIERSHTHALLVAQVAAGCFREPHKAQEAMLSGMMHDVGELVLATVLHDDFELVVSAVTAGAADQEKIERDVFGASHAEIGAYLLGLWGLPEGVAETAAFHHDPRRLPHGVFDVVDAVHVADALVHECSAAGAAGGERRLDLEWLREMGALTELDRWRANAQAIAERLAQEATA
jgi:HD-like signal output (HDOD) protein